MNFEDTCATDVTSGTEAVRMFDLYRDEINRICDAKTRAEVLAEKFLHTLKNSCNVDAWFRLGQLEMLEECVRHKRHDDKSVFIRDRMLDLIFGNDGFWKKHKVEITELCFHGYDRHGCDIRIKAHGEEYILYVPVYEHTTADRETIENGLLSAYDYQYKCHRKEKAKSSEHFSAYEFVDGKSAYASFDYKVPCNAIRAAIEASAKGGRNGKR